MHCLPSGHLHGGLEERQRVRGGVHRLRAWVRRYCVRRRHCRRLGLHAVRSRKVRCHGRCSVLGLSGRTILGPRRLNLPTLRGGDVCCWRLLLLHGLRCRLVRRGGGRGSVHRLSARHLHGGSGLGQHVRLRLHRLRTWLCRLGDEPGHAERHGLHAMSRRVFRRLGRRSLLDLPVRLLLHSGRILELYGMPR